jgi:hypothetical protein
MFRTSFVYTLIFFVLLSATRINNAEHPAHKKNSLYDKLKLSELGLSVQAFDCAMEGWQKIKHQALTKNNNIISIIDFS